VVPRPDKRFSSSRPAMAPSMSRSSGFRRCRGQRSIFTRATSLGGNHSLVEHRASVEGPTTMAPVALLRLSIGLEHFDDLISDLDQGLRVLAC
jgi:cystathionine beta-lyase/cystathionine gamma-synthase